MTSLKIGKTTFGMLRVCLAATVLLSMGAAAQAQRTMTDHLETLKAAGYPDLRALSFAQTKKSFAMTGLYRGTAETSQGEVYYAQLESTRSGAGMSFKTVKPCARNEHKLPRETRIIKVDGQKVEVVFLCLPGLIATVTEQVFLVFSDEGKDFVSKAFAKNPFVVVEIGDLPIPFATEGFTELLARDGGKAL